MAIYVGQLIKGARATYKLVQLLKSNTVFKAQIVDSFDLNNNWYVCQNVSATETDSFVAYNLIRAIVKTCSSDLDQILLAREYRSYQIPDFATSPYIRHMLEAIGMPQEQGNNSIAPALHPPCLIFEWMDTDLWHVPSKPFRNDTELPKVVCRSVLSALAIFKKHGKTHTGSQYLLPMLALANN